MSDVLKPINALLSTGIYTDEIILFIIIPLVINRAIIVIVYRLGLLFARVDFRVTMKKKTV